MEKDYCKMFNILDEYLKDKVQDIDLTILEAVSARNNGKVFSFEEHIKGFIYAQLSALVSWKKIKNNQSKFDELFCNFDRSELKEQSPDFLIEEIKKIKCYSPYTTKKQMYSLKANIETFEKIEQDLGSLEKFITHTTPVNIIKLLEDSKSTYKLKYSGVAIVCEYLRNVGIDIIKPDVHIKRITAADRLNLLTAKSDYKVIDEFRELSQNIGISQVKMDYLLWNYCSKGYGEVCTAKPKCENCVIREYCNKGKMSVIEEIEEFIKPMPIGYEFSRKWFKTELSKQYNRSAESYIPSDYCYNRKNKGINYDKQPHYFLRIGQGQYKYVGKDYIFTGKVEEKPRIKN